MDKQAFALALRDAAVLCQAQFLAGTVEVYEEEFSTWPIEDFRAAILAAARGQKRFPSVSEIRKHRPRKSAGYIEQAKEWEREGCDEDREAAALEIKNWRKG